jgi:hypothetical protein
MEPPDYAKQPDRDTPKARSSPGIYTKDIRVPDADAVTVSPDGEVLATFDSGATRSKDADDVRYDLVSPIGLRRLAERYALGAKKHGDRNWEKGVPVRHTMNHLQRHIEKWRSGDRSEDHLAAAAWGLVALMHYEETLPELFE